jgi:hypothetical protein
MEFPGCIHLANSWRRASGFRNLHICRTGKNWWNELDLGRYRWIPNSSVRKCHWSVQTATDLIVVDPMLGPEDFGPLTIIGVGNPPLDPADYGIVLGSSSFTLVPLGIPKADFTTPGTYELTALVTGNFVPDQGALTIAATPEPSSAALMLSGVGLGLMMLMRMRNSHSKPGP